MAVVSIEGSQSRWWETQEGTRQEAHHLARTTAKRPTLHGSEQPEDSCNIWSRVGGNREHFEKIYRQPAKQSLLPRGSWPETAVIILVSNNPEFQASQDLEASFQRRQLNLIFGKNRQCRIAASTHN